MWKKRAFGIALTQPSPLQLGRRKLLQHFQKLLRTKSAGGLSEGSLMSCEAQGFRFGNHPVGQSSFGN